MFAGCSSLTDVDLSRFDMSNVINVSGLFSNCSSLTSVNLSGFRKAKLVYTSSMFFGCTQLENIVLNDLNTAAVTTMETMFSGCTALKTIDICGFDTGNVTRMALMFANCPNLATIYVGDGWTTEKVTYGTNMFSFDWNLKGGQGTAYNHNQRGYEYACVDGGSAAPGYLTYKKYVAAIPGDVNGDAVVNVADVVALVNDILGNIGVDFNADAADVNSDGKVDVNDVVSVVNIIRGHEDR